MRALGIMGAPEGLPLVKAMLKLRGSTLAQEALAARRAMLRAGPKRKK